MSNNINRESEGEAGVVGQHLSDNKCGNLRGTLWAGSVTIPYTLWHEATYLACHSQWIFLLSCLPSHALSHTFPKLVVVSGERILSLYKK